MWQVSWGDYWRAADRWHSVTEEDYGRGTFDKFLGCNMLTGLDDLPNQRIRLLNGPYYRAIIKAYLVRTNHV